LKRLSPALHRERDRLVRIEPCVFIHGFPVRLIESDAVKNQDFITGFEPSLRRC